MGVPVRHPLWGGRMSQGLAYVNGKWERVSGSDLQLGVGNNQAARGDHGHMLGNGYRDIIQASMTGGGEVAYRNGCLKWTSRFISIGTGRGAAMTTAGWVGFYCPTAGETIQGAFGKANVLATADGVPMTAWDQLYAVLPTGGHSGTIPTSAYRLVAYNSATEIQIPENWVWIAGLNGDVGTQYPLVKLCNGSSFVLNYQHRPDVGWTALAFSNGWRDYGAGFETGAYRRLNDICFVRGLITGGTITTGTVIATLPAGFRPGGDTHTVVAANASFAIVNISTAGLIKANTNIQSNWTSLSNISFPCEN